MSATLATVVRSCRTEISMVSSFNSSTFTGRKRGSREAAATAISCTAL
jgi:hypothetical protein